MFEKIRRRVANSTWNDFLKVLMMYVDNVINEVELQELVSCVIGTASNDLVGMFEDFMRRCAHLEMLLRQDTIACCGLLGAEGCRFCTVACILGLHSTFTDLLMS